MTVIMSFGTTAYVPLERYLKLKEGIEAFLKESLDEKQDKFGYTLYSCRLCQLDSHSIPFDHSEYCPCHKLQELVKC